LTVSDSDPRSVADREFRRHLFAGHPYGRRVSGEGADLTALRREDLKAFWQQAARPDQAVLVISGALASDHGIAMAERLFGGWKSAGAPPSREPAAPAKPGGNHILLVDWPGAAQTEIRVGGLGLVNRDPEKPIADLVSSYFGGSFGSRLMNKIRVEKGATYGVNGGFAADRFAGTFRVSTFTKTATSAETLQTVLGQVRDLVERPPTAEELALHRRYFLGSAAARYETAGQIANQLAHNLLNDLPLDYMKRSCEMIDSAQASQCDSLIRRIVDPGNLLIVVVGDASRIRKDLESIGPVSPLDRDGKPKEAVQ
jgi:zinc protease